MLSMDEALALIVEHAGRQPTTQVDLLDALGCTLATPVTSDIDSPPFTKSLMDGFAVRTEDLPNKQGALTRIGEVVAGAVATQAVGPKEAMQIMTGAPVPDGVDAVVMVEKTKLDGRTVHLDDPDLEPGQNIMPKGRELSMNETVLEPGHQIGTPEIGLLATVGCPRPTVYQRPTVAVMSTGDELVEPDQTPGPGQIRNSNASTVAALVAQADASLMALGTAKDEEDDIRTKLTRGLNADILVLSGGVSAGKRDLVPKVLTDLGVQEIFHKIRFKPGKPLWFGKKDDTLVFGLPGNPVSVLVCFEVFVKTALRARQTVDPPLPPFVSARVQDTFPYRTRRTTLHPARLWTAHHQYWVQPTSWYGSPDLRALTAANALVEIPIGDGPHEAGTALRALPIRPLL